MQLVFQIIVRFLKRLIGFFMPHILNYTMTKIHFQIDAKKSKLFNEAFDQVNTTTSKKSGENNVGSEKTARLDILELGIGTGMNFKLYPKHSNLTILDKTDAFLPLLKKSIANEGRNDLVVSKLVVGEAENMKSIESNSMDVCVHTFMLCSIVETKAVLLEIYRVLRPGGVCVFVEHAAEKRNVVRRLSQRFIQPVLGGCQFKDIKRIVQSGPYDKVVVKDEETLSGILFNVINPVVYGYGIKKSN